MNIRETEINIKKELRASMNGILSARMREAGMPFKLIFGVELPRLRNIACEFPQDEELANHLWQQNIRETRLLAIMLMPAESFTEEVAEAWVNTMVTAEEAQILAMILLHKMPKAKEACICWLEERKCLPAISACLCLRHLIVKGLVVTNEEKLLIESFIHKLQAEANLHLRKAIQALTDVLDI